MLRVELARALKRVFDGANLDVALASFAPEDRPFAQALLYAACRHHYSNAALIALSCERRPKPLIGALLQVALSELRFLSTPPHAAVHESVAAARSIQASSAGFVNALLRRLQRERVALEARALEGIEARYEHPSWLLDTLRKDWPGQLDAICAAANTAPPMWLRVDARSEGRDAYRRRLAALDIECTAPVAPPHALRLAAPVAIDRLPDFALGAVSVQDAAAQRIVGALDARAGHRVLDACAAPGGKSVALAEAVPGIQLVAVDRDATRVQRLRDTFGRCRIDAEIVVADSVTHTYGADFDRIVIDAPCTGTGVIRRHPDIKLLRRSSDVAALVAEQRRLLDGLWLRLKPGGRMVYATCSILRAENSEQIAAFLARTPRARLLPMLDATWGHDTGAGFQNLPGEGDEDGFFYAILERTA